MVLTFEPKNIENVHEAERGGGGEERLEYFITDIHGDLQGFELLLRHVGIDFAKDRLVIGGDMINRGKDGAGVVKAVKALADRYPSHVQVLIGNHEEMMGDYFRRGDRTWFQHGGEETPRIFRRTFPDEAACRRHMEWAYSLPLVAEDDEFVYTHAGLNPCRPLHEQERDILWMSEEEFYAWPREALLRLTGGRPIIHGHTPVERIYFDGVRMNCDLGSNTYSVVEERGLGLVNLTEMVYYVYKPAQNRIEKRNILRY